MSEAERADILRAAIGFALGEEPIGLARLREKYAAKMADGPDRRAFDVVSAPIGTGGAEFQDVARKVASVDTLDTFLRDMRARYPEKALAPAAAKDAAAKDAAPPAKTNPPPKPAAANSPLPPKAPAGVPLKPDPAPTGSIAPRARTVNR